MKKLLLLCFILFALVSFVKADTVIVVGQPTACIKDTSNLVMDTSSFSNDGGFDLSANAEGQSISYASEWTLYSIRVFFGAAGDSNCAVAVRIGPDKDLTSTYMEEWTHSTFTGDAEYIEFVSVDNDTYAGSTSYYIGIVETNGTCVSRYDNTSPPYAGGMRIAAGTVWNMDGGTDIDRDYHIDVYKCQ